MRRVRKCVRRSARGFIVSSALAAVACSGGRDVTTTTTGGGALTPEPSSAAAPTYHGDVAPIISQKCAACHQPGGIAPFALTTYEPARARASQIAAYTRARIMPPFLIETGGECGSFDESTALTEAEIATIGEWVEAGAPEGTPVELAPRSLPELAGGRDFDLPLFEPRVEGGPLAEFDEYRCFPVEHGLDADRYVTGYDVVPGNARLVHHVLAFIIDPNQEVGGGLSNGDVMGALDDESPDRVGWPCFGMAGEGIEVESVPVSWAPGQGVVDYPDGLGVSFRRDRVLVAQVHYNLAEGAAPGDTDQTTVRLRLADSVERQGFFLLNDDLIRSLGAEAPRRLPAGRESVVVDWTRRLGELGVPAGLDLELVGLFPHMHGYGRKYTFEVSNGGGFECQGRINRWDFNWQRIYQYSVPVPVDADTQFRVTCEYDTRGAEADVMPGWGTRNEMCFVMGMLALPPGVFF